MTTIPMPPNSPVIPCPLREGLHLWIWPGGRNEGWKTAREQAERVLALGGVGVIPQAGLIAPAWLAGRDHGESKPRVEIFQSYGLQVTAGLGMDGSNATRETIVRAINDALAMPDVCVMGDEEKQLWETVLGRLLAQNIVDDVLSLHALAYMICVLCPWWKPNVHTGAPDRIFQALFRHFFCQDYGAHGNNVTRDETLWMLGESRREYAVRGIPVDYVHLAAQMYGHTRDNATKIIFSGERRACLWDVEEMDAIFAHVMHAYCAIQHLGFATNFDGIEAFQRASSLPVTRQLDDATYRALGVAA